VKLGGDRGARLTAKARKKGNAAMAQKAAARAADLAPTIASLQERGYTSLTAIAQQLNEAGIPTARGDGEWSPMQVSRILKRQ